MVFQLHARTPELWRWEDLQRVTGGEWEKKNGKGKGGRKQTEKQKSERTAHNLGTRVLEGKKNKQNEWCTSYLICTVYCASLHFSFCSCHNYYNYKITKYSHVVVTKPKNVTMGHNNLLHRRLMGSFFFYRTESGKHSTVICLRRKTPQSSFNWKEFSDTFSRWHTIMHTNAQSKCTVPHSTQV